MSKLEPHFLWEVKSAAGLGITMDLEYNKDWVSRWSLWGHHDFVEHYILAKAPLNPQRPPDAKLKEQVQECVEGKVTPSDLFSKNCVAAAVSFAVTGPYGPA